MKKFIAIVLMVLVLGFGVYFLAHHASAQTLDQYKAQTTPTLPQYLDSAELRASLAAPDLKVVLDYCNAQIKLKQGSVAYYSTEGIPNITNEKRLQSLASAQKALADLQVKCPQINTEYQERFNKTVSPTQAKPASGSTVKITNNPSPILAPVSNDTAIPSDTAPINTERSFGMFIAWALVIIETLVIVGLLVNRKK